MSKAYLPFQNHKNIECATHRCEVKWGGMSYVCVHCSLSFHLNDLTLTVLQKTRDTYEI
jgi:hypothetical protein